MAPIEFTGIGGEHGTTTVALAAAATLATRGPTRIATHDRKALCATVGIAPDGLPLPLTDNLELADTTREADVIDAGTVNRTRCHRGRPQEGCEPLRIGVLRGPDYLGLRTLCEHTGAPLGGLVMISEPGRALNARDVEQVSGCSVVAVIDHTPSVARIIDAGAFMHRHQRLREFTQLRHWLTPTTRTQETHAPLPTEPTDHPDPALRNPVQGVAQTGLLRKRNKLTGSSGANSRSQRPTADETSHCGFDAARCGLPRNHLGRTRWGMDSVAMSARHG